MINEGAAAAAAIRIVKQTRRSGVVFEMVISHQDPDGILEWLAAQIPAVLQRGPELDEGRTIPFVESVLRLIARRCQELGCSLEARVEGQQGLRVRRS